MRWNDECVERKNEKRYRTKSCKWLPEYMAVGSVVYEKRPIFLNFPTLRNDRVHSATEKRDISKTTSGFASVPTKHGVHNTRPPPSRPECFSRRIGFKTRFIENNVIDEWVSKLKKGICFHPSWVPSSRFKVRREDPM